MALPWGFGVLLKDTLTCSQEELGVEPLTLGFINCSTNWLLINATHYWSDRSWHYYNSTVCVLYMFHCESVTVIINKLTWATWTVNRYFCRTTVHLSQFHKQTTLMVMCLKWNTEAYWLFKSICCLTTCKSFHYDDIPWGTKVHLWIQLEVIVVDCCGKIKVAHDHKNTNTRTCLPLSHKSHLSLCLFRQTLQVSKDAV